MAIISFIFIAIGILSSNPYLKPVWIFIGVLIIIFTLNFFRDPERKTPNEKNILVSPADGTVLFVKEVEENKYLSEPGLQISIFMSPLNVHVNRIPIDGKVEYLKYIQGKYLVAYDDKASEENERSEIGILSKYGKVFFTQIAGFVARRIVYELQVEDDVKIGERFGMIKFGSRVDVVVPRHWLPQVKKDDKVFAGETILFRIPESQ